MSGELILVIDDSREIVKHLTEHLLPTFGYKTQHAFDGRSGLGLIRQLTPDLVMLDQNLPEMTGLDVLRHLAEESVDVPVVLMTGYGSEKSAIEAFRLGVRDYLVKPFTVDEVVDTINRALIEKRLRQDRDQLAEELRRTHAAMRRQLNEISTLFGIGKSLTSLLSVDKVLDRVLDAAVELSRAEESAIWLIDEEKKQLNVYARKGQSEDLALPNLPLENEYVGRVIQSGRATRQAAFSGEGIKVKTGYLARAVLYVPLKLRGNVLGVLGVSNRSAPRAFSERDEFLMSALADYAAIALENARVFQEADRALAAGMEELAVLIHITRAITSSLNLGEVLRLTIKAIHESWHIEASSIWLLNESRHSLRVVANVGTPSEVLRKLEVPLGKGFVGHTAATGKWIYANDVANDSLHYRVVDNETGFITRSLLCVPLIFRSKVMGALQLINKLDGDFDDQDVERALSIATAVAIAVTNALLFKQAESRQQQLETLSAAKSNFVATVSHDLRAPLNSISSLVSALDEVGPLNVKQQQFAHTIQHSVDNMLELVGGLLELARVTSSIEQVREPVNMLDVVQAVVTDLHGQAFARNTILSLSNENGAGPIQGDPTQLRQAISNLVDNAIKYSPPGREVRIAVQTQARNVLVSVRDRGVGIAAADLPYIFDKFYRVQNGEVTEGIGLGLTLVRSIAEVHGGQVWAESEKGVGSTFTLQLPRPPLD